MEKLFSRPEAARLIGISVSTLDIARRNGRISFIQFVDNGKVYFTENGINEYIARATHRVVPKRDNIVTYRKRRI